MAQNKDSAAVAEFEKATKVETNELRKSKSFHNMGVICQKHQMFGEAIQAYQESLRNNPNDNETRYNLSLCKRQQKKQQQNQNNQNQNQDKKDNKQDQDKQSKDNQKNNDQQDQQTQPPKDQMSKENAEQLLNAAMQEEKATQQRMKKETQAPRRRQLQKNW